jgi:hypothetical protein
MSSLARRSNPGQAQQCADRGTSSSPGWNIGGVLFGRSGYAIAIPIGWVPQAVMSGGGITAAVNLSMVLDYTGKMSYADQLVLLGNAIPILDLALGAFEEFKYGWWEDGKQDFRRCSAPAPDGAGVRSGAACRKCPFSTISGQSLIWV